MLNSSITAAASLVPSRYHSHNPVAFCIQRESVDTTRAPAMVTAAEELDKKEIKGRGDKIRTVGSLTSPRKRCQSKLVGVRKGPPLTAEMFFETYDPRGDSRQRCYRLRRLFRPHHHSHGRCVGCQTCPEMSDISASDMYALMASSTEVCCANRYTHTMLRHKKYIPCFAGWNLFSHSATSTTSLLSKNSRSCFEK